MLKEKINYFKGRTCDTTKELDSVKADLAQCLQIDNLSFLLGSGCSSYKIDDVELAIATMRDLAEDFFAVNPDFEVANKKLKSEYNNNLESMLDFLIAAQMVNDIIHIDDNISEKIRVVKKFIKDKIVSGLSCKEVLDTYKCFYLKCIRHTRKNPINIFTTNYDMYNEQALDDLGFFYNNGFTGTYNRRFNPISYNYAYVENMNLNKDVWDRIANFFNLYKIHGSINWISKDEKIYEKSISEINDNDTVMIYPTPLKDRTTLMTPYSDLLRTMQQSFMKPNSILISLGYSFSDSHINRIVLNALAVPSFRLIIFGSGPEINKLIELNDSRIWVINSTTKIHYFKKFVDIIMPEMQDELIEQLRILNGSSAMQQLEKNEVADE